MRIYDTNPGASTGLQIRNNGDSNAGTEAKIAFAQDSTTAAEIVSTRLNALQWEGNPANQDGGLEFRTVLDGGLITPLKLTTDGDVEVSTNLILERR